MKKIITMSLWTLLVALVSCKPRTAAFESVNADAFAKVIAQEEVQLLDVRTPEEYAQGHIAHSVNLDVTADGFVEKAKDALDAKGKVALYCRSGRRSKRAAELLTKEGFTVVELAGGFNEWKESQRPYQQ